MKAGLWTVDWSVGCTLVWTINCTINFPFCEVAQFMQYHAPIHGIVLILLNLQSNFMDFCSMAISGEDSGCTHMHVLATASMAVSCGGSVTSSSLSAIHHHW